MSDEKTSGPTGLLSFAERELIIARLKERGAPKQCELCGHAKWQIGLHMVAPAPVMRSGSGIVLLGGDPLAVSAQLYCENCGNTKLLNLGLLDLKETLLRSPANTDG